jgi:transaldolase
MNTKIFLDSGNPAETKEAKEVLGFLDGQTTNPTLVAKNPHIQALKEAGGLTEEVIWDNYKKIAFEIHEVIPGGAISVEVYADMDTEYEIMLAKGRELATWFPGIYVKLPITHNGLLTARKLVEEGIRVNMTLCFTQEQAAAVHEATSGAPRGHVFVSPFIGRLDDIGYEGMHLIKNIVMMYREWNSHVEVLGASIRNLSHLFGCIESGADCITAPLDILKTWATYGVTKNTTDYPREIGERTPILYRDIPRQDWVLYNIDHELTKKGIEKFSEDWKALFS